jgi:ABC-type Fe3+/spermidine/putrescine transport system ATPase subunit
MVRLPGVENRMPSQLVRRPAAAHRHGPGHRDRTGCAADGRAPSALDENLREEMRREVDNLQQMLGVTTIFVTHDQREALSMSDKILVMKAGRKQQEGSPETVYNEPANHFVADFLGHSNFIKGEVVGVDDKHVNVKIETGDVLFAENKGGFSKATRWR